MDFLTDDYLDGRCTKHSVIFDVPTRSGKNCRTSGDQSSKICGGGACDETALRFCRQAKDFADPCQDYFFELRRDGRHDSKRGILIPGVGEPTRSGRGWKRTTDNKSEVAPTHGGDRRRSARLVQKREHRKR